MKLLLEHHCVNNEGCLCAAARASQRRYRSCDFSMLFFFLKPVLFQLCLNLGLLIGKEV